MPRFMALVGRSLLFVAISYLPATFADAQQSYGSPEDQAIVDTVSAMFKAVQKDDEPKYHSLTEPGFFLFDGGKRFTGDGIMALMKAQQAAGNRYDWSVTEPQVHISGNVAWIAYTNQGSVTSATGTKARTWLESAVLQRENVGWKIVFMHSTPVAP